MNMRGGIVFRRLESDPRSSWDRRDSLARRSTSDSKPRQARFRFLRIASLIAMVVGSISTFGVLATSSPAGAISTVPAYYFNTGTTQTWGPAPSNETIEILALGAAGGSDFYGGTSTTGGDMQGGLGGAELATLSVTTGESLTITVGGVGGNAVAYFSGGGGYGGGAGGGGGGDENAPGGAGGGGASTVANGSTALLVAAGGGGAGGSDCEYSFISGCIADYPDAGGEGGSGGGSSGASGQNAPTGLSAPGGGGGGGGTTSGSSGTGGSGGTASVSGGTCPGHAGGSGSAGGGGSACSPGAGGGGGGGGGLYGGGGGGSGGEGLGISGGGGGGGGSSYANSTYATSASSENGANASAGYVEIGRPGTLNLPLIGGAVTAANARGGGPSTWCSCVAAAPVGQPVDAMDGDFYESTTDLSVSGPGVPLDFVRTYDANAAQTSAGSNPSGLGPGWTDNLAMSVSSALGTATVTEEDGAQVQFTTYNPNNPWCASSFNYCPVAPRDISTLNQNSDGTWTFRNDKTSPLTYTFSTAGALTKVANAAGQSITGTTEAPSSGACPSSATTCTLWTSNAATPNPTLTEVYVSGELTELLGFATTGGTAPVATFCYYGESACSPPSSGGLTSSLYSVTDPGMGATTYSYDATNSNTALRYDLLTRTDPDGGVLTNVYNSGGQITKQTDPSGVVRTLSYSEVTTALPIGDAPGDSTTVSMSPGTGSTSQSTQYTFFSGEVASTTLNPGGTTASTTTVADSPITGQNQASTDPNGNSTTTSLPNPSMPGAYLNAIDPSQTVDALSNTTLYAYTTANQVWCEVEPSEVANGVTCPSTQPTTPPSPGAKSTLDTGATITYYDTAGNPTYVTDPLGNTTETSYTSAELPWCKVDADQFTVAGVSCPSSPPSSPPTGTTTGYTTTLYNAAGNITSVTDPTGATTTYAYGNSSFPNTATQTTDPQGDVTTTTLDTAGRPISETETFGSYSATTLTGYDSSGRVFCTIQPLAFSQGDTSCPSSAPTSPPTPGTNPWPGAQINIYNGNAQPTFEISPIGGVTETAYNAAGQVYCTVSAYDYTNGATCPATPPTSAPTGTATGYTTTIYDAEGRTASVTDPIGDTTTSAYDLDGNAIASTYTPANTTSDPARTTDYQFNADDEQIASCTNPDGVALDAPGTCAQANVTAVSCAGATFCMGVDDNDNALAFDGSTWGGPDTISAERSAGSEPTALSCPTSSFCMAVDSGGGATSFNGSTWSSLMSVEGSSVSLVGVSCASASFCVANDKSGDVSIYNGTSWSTPSDPDTSGPIDAVSCTSSTFCMGVDANGEDTDLVQIGVEHIEVLPVGRHRVVDGMGPDPGAGVAKECQPPVREDLVGRHRAAAGVVDKDVPIGRSRYPARGRLGVGQGRLGVANRAVGGHEVA